MVNLQILISLLVYSRSKILFEPAMVQTTSGLEQAELHMALWKQVHLFFLTFVIRFLLLEGKSRGKTRSTKHATSGYCRQTSWRKLPYSSIRKNHGETTGRICPKPLMSGPSVSKWATFSHCSTEQCNPLKDHLKGVESLLWFCWGSSLCSPLKTNGSS